MNFNLKDHTILLVIGGSRAYGINRPDSDLDIKGILIPPIQQYRLGALNKIEQVDSKAELGVYNDVLPPGLMEVVRLDSIERHPNLIAPEGAIYDIQKYFTLALGANPNILEVVWSEDSLVLLETREGKILRENRSLFLSKKVIYSYRGYAFSQMRRISSHRSWLLNPPKEQPTRQQFGLPENTSVLSADEQDAFLWILSEILKEKIATFKLSDVTREELGAISLRDAAAFGIPDRAWPAIQLATGASDSFISAMMKERQYRTALNHWHSYIAWKASRNPKRAVLEEKFGFDCKFACHVVRLMCQCVDIISKQHLYVTLPQDQKEMVVAVRDGAFTYDQLVEWFEKKTKDIDDLVKTSKLPHSPDSAAADKLLIELQMERINNVV